MLNPIRQPWRIPIALTCISLIPFMATANRLVSLQSPDVNSDPNLARFDGSFEALILHILTGSLFLLLSVFQFSSVLRNAKPIWHRRIGMVAMAAGALSGFSGVWLILIYPPSELATATMDVVRIFAGLGLVVCIGLSAQAIRKRAVAIHRAWMIRAFALGVAGSTQALVIGAWLALIGPLTPDSATALITAGFLINIGLAEWRIRARPVGISNLNPQRTPL